MSFHKFLLAFGTPSACKNKFSQNAQSRWPHIYSTNEPPHDKTNKMACVLSKDSDQPGNVPSLIRVFAVCMKKAWVLSYPLSAQRRLWSDWADAQADLSLRWVHSHFVGLVMRWLKCRYPWTLAWHSPIFFISFLEKLYCSRKTENAQLVYFFVSSNAKPEVTQIVFLFPVMVWAFKPLVGLYWPSFRCVWLKQRHVPFKACFMG